MTMKRGEGGKGDRKSIAFFFFIESAHSLFEKR
jgi:hypothetical protein